MWLILNSFTVSTMLHEELSVSLWVAVTAVSNVGPAMQVCTQPQICDERPHWELRPYLTHSEAHNPPALSCSLSPSLSLSPYILSAFSEQGGGGGGCHTEKGSNKQGGGVGGGGIKSERVTENRKKKKRKRGADSGGALRWSASLRLGTSEQPDPWHKYDTPATPPNFSITICMDPPSPLIMLITCPAPTDPKNGCI